MDSRLLRWTLALALIGAAIGWLYWHFYSASLARYEQDKIRMNDRFHDLDGQEKYEEMISLVQEYIKKYPWEREQYEHTIEGLKLVTIAYPQFLILRNHANDRDVASAVQELESLRISYPDCWLNPLAVNLVQAANHSDLAWKRYRQVEVSCRRGDKSEISTRIIHMRTTGTYVSDSIKQHVEELRSAYPDAGIPTYYQLLVDKIKTFDSWQYYASGKNTILHEAAKESLAVVLKECKDPSTLKEANQLLAKHPFLKP